MSTQKVRPDRGFVERQEFRQRRRMRNRKIGAYAMVAAMVAIAMVAIVEIRNGPTPPIPAVPTEDLGIFAPVAGRILYVNGGTDDVVGADDLNYEPGLWAVDPSGPSDTVEGPRVADEVTSTLVPLGLDEGALPRGWSNHDEPLLLGWSSHGTELLFTHGRFDEYLYVLHADGSETRLNAHPMLNPHAAISPDGSRVAFLYGGLSIVDTDGGSPEQLPYPRGGEPTGEMTFSPDGTQIAYLGDDGVWVVNADGTDAHEIVANEATRNALQGFSGLQWSPAGDRLAIGLGYEAIYTFAPDGSDFGKVISDGVSPFWSPDGSQIAYTVSGGSHGHGLAIADADGSNVREFGFGSSGPWHPGDSLPELRPAVAPVWSPVQERDALAVHSGRPEDYGIAWRDPHDAPVGWVDVERVFTQESSDGYWTIELAARPPPAAGIEPGLLIAYGLVLDTTGDGVADYLVGIDNDAPQRGDFHVWVTNLTTGETDEQIGPPYGYPIEFSHPDEWKPGDNYNPRTLVLTFLNGSGLADLDPETVRFYAWASASRNGKVFASDYAPDTGWMTRT